MERIEPIVWTEEDRALWTRLAAHDFEPAGASLTFAARLARDHGWSLDAARAAIDEYRRFCFLALRAGREVTPSEEVDEVWHQHLTYSRDYWQVWCREILATDLHHGPTRGGPREAARFAEQYAGTLAAYEVWFGPPPADLWPGTGRRFRRARFRIVDRDAHLVVPTPLKMLRRLLRGPWRTLALVAVGGLSGVRPAAAGALDVLDWTAGPFLLFYVSAVFLSFGAACALPWLLSPRGAREPSRARLEPTEVALLAGGTTRAADTFVLQALAAHEASLDGDTVVTANARRSRGDLARDLADSVEAVRARLVVDGLALSHERRAAVGVASVAAMVPVFALGIAKVGVGHARDKPVGILEALLLATAVIAVALACLHRPASRAGRRLLAAHLAENGRAIRAPRREEVVAAFAAVGVGALAGTELEAYRSLIAPAGDGGSSGGDSGGGGDGGGGCGGCGGGGD